MSQKFVLITGASSGIGRATAELLASSGYTVFAGVRSQAARDALESRDDPHLIPITLDVTDAEHIAQAYHTIEEATRGAGLMALCNNAGSNYISATEYSDEDAARLLMESHFWGTARLTSTFIPLLRRHAQAHTHSARIINVGSIASLTAMPFIQYYSAAKFAILGFSESLQFELAPANIHTSVMIVGAVQTDIWHKTNTQLEQALARLPGDGTDDHYRERLTSAGQTSDRIKRHAITAERAALIYKKALEARRPKFRYYVGLDARIANLATRLLPTRQRHFIIRKVLAASTSPS